MNENLEKANLIKKAIVLVDKLAQYDIDDFENFKNAEIDFEELQLIIKQAKDLKKNRHWNLN